MWFVEDGRSETNYSHTHGLWDTHTNTLRHRERAKGCHDDLFVTAANQLFVFSADDFLLLVFVPDLPPSVFDAATSFLSSDANFFSLGFFFFFSPPALSTLFDVSIV